MTLPVDGSLPGGTPVDGVSKPRRGRPAGSRNKPKPTERLRLRDVVATAYTPEQMKRILKKLTPDQAARLLATLEPKMREQSEVPQRIIFERHFSLIRLADILAWEEAGYLTPGECRQLNDLLARVNAAHNASRPKPEAPLPATQDGLQRTILVEAGGGRPHRDDLLGRQLAARRQDRHVDEKEAIRQDERKWQSEQMWKHERKLRQVNIERHEQGLSTLEKLPPDGGLDDGGVKDC